MTTFLFAAVVAIAIQAANDPCVPHIELYGGAFWAEELRQPVKTVLATHRITLWERPGDDRGKKLGEMLVGSRAEILSHQGEYYNVASPLDGSVGWVNKIQVARTHHQRRTSRTPCKPAK